MNYRSLYLIAAALIGTGVGMGCLSSTICCDSKPILQSGFEADPAIEGWKAIVGGQFGKTILWSDNNPYQGKHCVQLNYGGMQSPRFPIKPRQYYRVTFAGKAEKKLLWAVYFFDKQGKLLPGDCYTSMDPAGAWTMQEGYFKTKYPAAEAALVLHALDPNNAAVDEVRVAPATRPEALAWADRVMRGMPEMKFTVPPGAEKMLANSWKKLRRGGSFRIALLGDSISNDLSNSPLDLFLERMYPRARVELRFTGRGATGFHIHQNFVQERVLAHKPDLVLMLAISHNTNEAAVVSGVQRIIDETRQALPKTDILILSSHKNQFNPETPKGNVQRAWLKSVADKNGVYMLDILSTWEKYAADNKKEESWLLRDVVHFNDRGRMLTAENVAAIFAPAQQP